MQTNPSQQNAEVPQVPRVPVGFLPEAGKQASQNKGVTLNSLRSTELRISHKLGPNFSSHNK